MSDRSQGRDWKTFLLPDSPERTAWLMNKLGIISVSHSLTKSPVALTVEHHKVIPSVNQLLGYL